jgi:ribosome maturation factor RimP
MNAATKTPQFDRARLDRALEPIVQAHGAEVVDVELLAESSGWTLRVSVERQGSAERRASTKDAAVALDQCVAIARDLSPALDVLDLITQNYSLEVGSPGVERPLRSAAEFERFAGSKAKVKLRNPVPAGQAGRGQKVLVGVIGPQTDGHVEITADGQPVNVLLSDVEWAHLVFEFGAAPKPGKNPAKKKQKR